LHGVLAQEGGPLEVVFGAFETRSLWIILLISLGALVFAYYLARQVLAAPEGTEKMRQIAGAIQVGAKAYLNRQFRTVGIFMALLTVVLFFALPVADLYPRRSIARVHPRRWVQRPHRIRGHVARRPSERPNGQRRA
jgi:Inorganic H+ pyrophosphatase